MLPVCRQLSTHLLRKQRTLRTLTDLATRPKRQVARPLATVFFETYAPNDRPGARELHPSRVAWKSVHIRITTAVSNIELQRHYGISAAASSSATAALSRASAASVSAASWRVSWPTSSTYQAARRHV